jgi:hypothetical protein
MFAIALRRERHTREYVVSASDRSGWELTMQEDLHRTRHVHYEDWHRVELALAVVQHEVRELIARGWRVEGEAS